MSPQSATIARRESFEVKKTAIHVHSDMFLKLEHRVDRVLNLRENIRPTILTTVITVQKANHPTVHNAQIVPPANMNLNSNVSIVHADGFPRGHAIPCVNVVQLDTAHWLCPAMRSALVLLIVPSTKSSIHLAIVSSAIWVNI